MSTTFDPTATSTAAYLSRPPRTDLSHIPGKYGPPIIGSLLPVMKDARGFQDRHIQRHGQLARMSLGEVKGILVTHPDHLQQVFLDPHENYSSTMGYEGALTRLFGGSLIVQDFSMHKASRRMFQTGFKRAALEGYVDIMNPTICENISDWHLRPDFRYVQAARELLIDIGARVFFGVSSDREQLQYMAHLFYEMAHVGMMSLLRVNLPGTKYWRGQRAKEKMYDLIRGYIKERRANPGTDLTSLLVNDRDDDGNFWPEDVLLPHLNLLLFAAHDTTAGATSHLLMHLAKPENQELQEKLRQEAFDLGTNNPTLEDLDVYEGMEHAVLESLRLHPTVTANLRRTTKDVRLGDRDIPADTVLFNMPHWAQLHPGYWTEPNRFDPDRFSEARKEHKRHSFQYFPFGGGAHKCLGMHLALMNAKLILHHSLRKYRFELQQGYDCRCVALPLPFPSKDLPLIVTKID